MIADNSQDLNSVFALLLFFSQFLLGRAALEVVAQGSERGDLLLGW